MSSQSDNSFVVIHFLSGLIKPHSCKALLRKCPASCISFSSSDQLFQATALSKVGIQSSNLFSAVKGSTAGALPRH